MRYLLDTDWIIDARIGMPAAIQAIDDLSDQGLAVSIVTLGELFDGAFNSSDPRHQLRELRAYLSPFVTLRLSDPIMETFGRTRSELRRRGQLIPDLDLLIAATALHHDLILLTRNRRHFTRIAGLHLYNAD